MRISLASLASSADEASSAVAPPAGLTGSIVNSRYRVNAVASVHRDAVVYSAEDIRRGRPIALKVLRGEFAADADFVAAVRVQARTLARSAHVLRGVQRVYECGETDAGQLFVALEWLEGGTLCDVLDAGGARGGGELCRGVRRGGEGPRRGARGAGACGRARRGRGAVIIDAMDDAKRRRLADKVGFAHTAAQMDAVMRRIEDGEGGRRKAELLRNLGITAQTAWRAAISPHDDYAYASYMYPLVLANVKAPTVIVIGVAHKARTLKLENRIVFDSFSHWHGAYGDIPVSSLRAQLTRRLDAGHFIVHDEMQAIEHSVESKLPFLQHFNRRLEIVSILVPAMPHERMREIAAPLARAIAAAAGERKWDWGRDYAIVISTDAVHYGDEEWGGRDFARFGTDELGYRQALDHEHTILAECFAGGLSPARTALFSRYTVREDDYREYKWTWCGRYSVPFGLLVAWNLQRALGGAPLEGKVLGYTTSIEAPRIEVKDLGGMGVTAPAHPRHWVGYAAVGYL